MDLFYIVGVIFLPIFIATLVYYSNSIKSELTDLKSLPHYLKILSQSNWQNRYQNYLDTFIHKSNSIFGNKKFSFEAFSRCFFLALIYPVHILLIMWVISGTSLVETLLPEIQIHFRILYFLFILSIWYNIYHHIVEFNNVLSNLLSLGYLLILLYVTKEYISLSMTLLLYPIGVGIGSYAYLQAGSKLYKGPGIYSYLSAYIIISAYMVEEVHTKGYESLVSIQNYSIFFLAIIIPSINALFDLLSIGFSRIILEKLVKKFTKFKALILSLTDLVVAFLLLVAFTFSLFFLFDTASYFFDQFNSDSLLSSNILSQDMMNWTNLMLVSTLVPTIINFSIALISIGTLEPQNQKINNWKEKLRQSIELREIKTSKHEQRKISEYILIHRLIIPILLVSLLLIGAIYLLGNILQELEITQQYISNLASHFAQFVQGLLIE